MTPDDPLPANLHFLCTYYPSVSEVCRRIGINRQQFNKYLSGRIRPSHRNMRSICEFFGVSESELLLPPGRLAEIVGVKRPDAATSDGERPYVEWVERLRAKAQQRLDRYVGFYFRYAYSFGYRGYIIKSLLRIYGHEGAYYWKTLEPLSVDDGIARVSYTFKYEGMLLPLADRIFVLEHETILRDSITQTILWPNYRTPVTFLLGLQTAIASTGAREPGASLVLLERLGPRIDVRKALGSCGLYHHTSEAIDPEIKARIANEVQPGEYVFKAYQP